MNRTKIVEAILREFRKHDPYSQEQNVREALRWIVNDMSLVCFAQSIGVDTDAVLKAA